MVKCIMFKGCAVLLFFLLICSSSAKAIVDPLESTNNHFGIHILSESDLEDAAKLVNSNGGEWGYVTVLIQDDDMDKMKWQRIFDKMRELKIIPIVRIATHPKDDSWFKPKAEDSQKWAEFLSSLNWVVKNRYIVLFNEPNHANEWEGEINPKEYTQIVLAFYKALKDKSEDFYILSAGFDVAAPNSNTTKNAQTFWKEMVQENPRVFELFDGWNSHSYPNPEFSASPLKTGKLSIQSFKWEVSQILKYGVNPNIPIFITETGWSHKEGKKSQVLGRTSDDIANFFDYAYKNVWNNPKVVAVTPFVLNFQNQPFDHFSWKKTDTEFYSQYQAVQDLPKVKGEPEQEVGNELVGSFFPPFLFSGFEMPFSIQFKNTGQTIWDINEGYNLFSLTPPIILKVTSFEKTKPGEIVNIKGKISKLPGSKNLVELTLTKGSIAFGEKYTNNFSNQTFLKGKFLTSDIFGASNSSFIFSTK